MEATEQERMSLPRVSDLPVAVRTGLQIFVLVLAFGLARFLLHGGFGFYGDDHRFIGRALSMSSGEFIDFLLDVGPILRFEGSGHPLHPLLISIGARIGWWIGRLQGLYWVAYLVGALNVGLFYALVARIHSRTLALIAGFTYALYAADTTQAYLTFALGLQTAITFILLAAHAYLSEKPFLTYPLAFLALMTYETAFALAFAFPLLVTGPRRRSKREFVRHIVLTAAILLLVIAWRALAGESRVGELSLVEVVRTPLSHMAIGPLVSLGTFLYRPLQAAQSATPAVILIAVAVFALALFSLQSLVGSLRAFDHEGDQGATFKAPQDSSPLSRIRLVWRNLDGGMRRLIQLAGAGLAMLVLAYPFTFTVRAYAITGRDTRVHAAGVVGAALLIGALILILLRLVRSPGRRRVVVILVSAWFGLLAGFGVLVQDGYRLAWEYQQRFWTSAEDYVGGLEEGAVVGVEPEGLIDTTHMDANTWNLPYVLKNIYAFPEDWEEPPRFYRLLPDWEQRALTNPTEVKALNYRWEYLVVPWEEFILLSTEGGRITSQETAVTIDGVSHQLSPLKAGSPIPYEKSFLYDYVILE